MTEILCIKKLKFKIQKLGSVPVFLITIAIPIHPFDKSFLEVHKNGNISSKGLHMGTVKNKLISSWN